MLYLAKSQRAYYFMAPTIRHLKSSQTPSREEELENEEKAIFYSGTRTVGLKYVPRFGHLGAIQPVIRRRLGALFPKPDWLTESFSAELSSNDKLLKQLLGKKLRRSHGLFTEIPQISRPITKSE